MDERTVSAGWVATVSAWACVVALLLAAWIVGLAGSRHVSHLLGYSACSMSAVAAVLHLRCLTSRACRYVVASSSMHPLERDLRPMR